MAFTKADSAYTWRIQEHSITSPKIVEIASTSTPYVNVDFSEKVVANITEISTPGTPTEVNSKTIGFADVALSTDNKIVSFQVTSNGGAGDYLINVPVTLGTTVASTISGRVTLRVV